MKKRIFFAAAVAALSLVGCSKNNVESTGEGGTARDEMVQLNVRLPETITKVTGTSSDAKVNDLQIFVFSRNGALETSATGTGASLSLTCTSGEKTVIALVNAPKENGVTNASALRAKTVKLEDCSPSDMVMAGEVTVNLKSSTTVTIPVTRLAAKVAISGIKTDFVLDQHKSLPFKVKSIYLINVAGDKAYFDANTPSLWYNKSKYVAATSPSFLYDAVTSGQITNGATYSKEHFFYCYPNNSTAIKTRLVVETEIDGYVYYYPLTLESVNSNTAYTYNLTITRLGSDSPDVPVEDGTIQFTVTVEDWIEQDINEII